MKFVQKIKRILGISGAKIFETNIEYWEERSKKYGAKAVLNLGLLDKENEIFEIQKQAIIPHLKAALDGTEQTLLDFGCGPGRFSSYLAKVTNCKVIAVDPIQSLLDAAPNQDNISYRLIKDGAIPVANASIDVLWVCLVLGGIKDKEIPSVVKEFKRVLRPGSLVCFVEKTAPVQYAEYWRSRSEEDYIEMFPFLEVEKKGEYMELDSTISIFIGREYFSDFSKTLKISHRV